MACLSCSLCLTKNLSNNNANDSSPSPQTNALKHPTRLEKKPGHNNRHRQSLKPRQPSVIEIERAIGAGRFQDADARGLKEEKNAKFDMSMMSFPEKFEGSLQKRLRETGESIVDGTERGFRLSGKKILMVTFTWIFPIWTLSLLVASGAVKLPFSNQFLDELLK